MGGLWFVQRVAGIASAILLYRVDMVIPLQCMHRQADHAITIESQHFSRATGDQCTIQSWQRQRGNTTAIHDRHYFVKLSRTALYPEDNATFGRREQRVLADYSDG